MKLSITSKSEIGPVRAHNADSIFTDEQLGLGVLADGIGSRIEAVSASRTVVDRVRSHVEEVLPPKRNEMNNGASGRAKSSLVISNILRDGVLLANEHLIDENRSNPKLEGNPIGSTVAGVFWPEPAYEYLAYCHVGDSRIYLSRNGELTALTRDHTAFEAWKMAGSDGESPGKNVLNRAVGVNPSLYVDVAGVKPKPNDTFMICSDGITGSLECAAIASLMDAHARSAGSTLCDAIISAAAEAGCTDNLSVIIARVSEV